MSAEHAELPADFHGAKMFFVGIKGTGMSALADLFHGAGAEVSGSDVPESFYTDRVLQDLAIPYVESFDASLLPDDTQWVIHSSAYKRDENPQLLKAQRLGMKLFSYTEALGLYSSRCFSVGICGVHGKTTTTALCGAMMKALRFPGSVLVGSALPLFHNRSVWVGGNACLVAETCEYQRHFLDFSPSVILLTSSEADHLDYFKDEADIDSAFTEYARKLPPDGVFIYCADQPGALRCQRRIRDEAKAAGKALTFIPYGRQATGDFQITELSQGDGCTRFSLAGMTEPLSLFLPGSHVAVDAAGAVAVLATLARKQGWVPEGLSPLTALAHGIRHGLASYTGAKRRSERVGEAGGIVILDDYAHHPTAIRLTLAGYRSFYPNRRIIVDFMSHTYSRTEALLDAFAHSFADADIVLLNKIYASAREQGNGSVSGRTLYEATAACRDRVYYFHEYLEALPWLLEQLRPGDLFVTMGAGDNWQLGRALLQALQGAAHD